VTMRVSPGAQQYVERLIERLRRQVADLRRLERTGAAADELRRRRRTIARLQEELAAVVRHTVSTA
jgi:hypothetical protein